MTCGTRGTVLVCLAIVTFDGVHSEWCHFRDRDTRDVHAYVEAHLHAMTWSSR